MALLRVGEIAPDFDVPALVGGVKRRFRLSDQLGKKNVLLAFYPSNWTLASAAQLMAFQAEKEKLDALALPISICVDSIMNTTVWEREIGPLDFPMCADFWPHGEVCREYGVLREQEPHRGSCEPALYLVDRHGRIAFRDVYPLEQPPDIQTVLARLKEL